MFQEELLAHQTGQTIRWQARMELVEGYGTLCQQHIVLNQRYSRSEGQDDVDDENSSTRLAESSLHKEGVQSMQTTPQSSQSWLVCILREGMRRDHEKDLVKSQPRTLYSPSLYKASQHTQADSIERRWLVYTPLW